MNFPSAGREGDRSYAPRVFAVKRFQFVARFRIRRQNQTRQLFGDVPAEMDSRDDFLSDVTAFVVVD
jgi:hypothetical protein